MTTDKQDFGAATLIGDPLRRGVEGRELSREGEFGAVKAARRANPYFDTMIGDAIQFIGASRNPPVSTGNPNGNANGAVRS
jgi:hypothetical protein